MTTNDSILLPGRVITAWSPLKVSLSGEHAVGYGGSSVVACVDAGVTVTLAAARSGGSFRCGRRFDSWTPADLARFHTEVDRCFDLVGPGVWRALASDFFAPFRYVVGSWCEKRHLSSLEIRSSDPGWIAAGLGTSSSSAAALDLACAAAAGMSLPRAEVAAQVRHVDRLRHGGIPSGVDGEVVLRGGVIRFRHAGVESLPSPEKVRLLMIHSGIRRSANRVIADFAAQKPELIDDFVRKMETVSDGVSAALTAGDRTALTHWLRRDQRILQSHGLSTPRLEELVSEARRLGAEAVKITGAGRGGALFALLPGEVPPRLVDFCRRNGLKTLVCSLSPTRCQVVGDTAEEPYDPESQAFDRAQGLRQLQESSSGRS